jgi:hypothetical protein
MVWRNFEAHRNEAQRETLLKLQKRFEGIIAGQGGRYHVEPLFAKYGILKVGDLYRQQLRMHTITGSSITTSFRTVRRSC